MNPFAILNPGRWLLYAALAAAVVAGYFAWADHIGDVREAKVRAEYTAAALKAEQAARKKEQALQSTVEKAVHEAKIRENKLAADAGRANAVAAGLRDDLAATRAKLSTFTRDALERYTNASADVFAQCVRSYSWLAAEADRIASDRQTLIDAWPK